jgi:hypothetical protein
MTSGNVLTSGKYDHPAVLIVVTDPPPLDPSTSFTVGSLNDTDNCSIYCFSSQHHSYHPLPLTVFAAKLPSACPARIE